MLAKAALTLVLLFTFYQDLRYRAVYWVSFPLLLALLLIVVLDQSDLVSVLSNTGYNLCFFIIQFLLVSVYFSVRQGRIINITSGYLGWGDILFLVCIAFYLSPANYLLFYMVSLIAILAYALILIAFGKRNLQIPLAGIQAMFLALLLIADWRIKSINVTNDYWLLTYADLI